MWLYKYGVGLFSDDQGSARFAGVCGGQSSILLIEMFVFAIFLSNLTYLRT